MPIWRVFFKEISATRGETPGGPLKIEVKPSVGSARVEGPENAKMGRVEYALEATYGEGFAKIRVAGDMLIIGRDVEKISNGRIADPELLRAVLQRIFVEPLAVAVYLAKELGLPMPIRVPQVRVEGQQ